MNGRLVSPSSCRHLKLYMHAQRDCPVILPEEPSVYPFAPLKLLLDELELELFILELFM